jgi:trans-aconitate 2-methyltransferase
MWDANAYLAHRDERSRPFADLLSRVRADAPARVVDLGCGPATLTAELARRWPSARVFGVDSSPEMLAAADEAREAGVELVEADLRQWRPDRPVDVLVSNATLQWVPGHLDLLPQLLDLVAPGGELALQVPGNFDQPSHRLLRSLAGSTRWRSALDAVAWPAAHDAPTYLEALAGHGWAVDAWETTYLHVLPGDDAVLGWVRGTALRPVLAALSEADAAEFLAAYGALLREAYPRRPYGTVLPFRRVFAVGLRPT